MNPESHYPKIHLPIVDITNLKFLLDHHTGQSFKWMYVEIQEIKWLEVQVETLQNQVRHKLGRTSLPVAGVHLELQL